MGKSKDDLAVLLTYVVLNQYLANGMLAFVITQSIFKTTGARGFSSFVLPSEPGAVMQVEDLSDIKPFPVLRTARP